MLYAIVILYSWLNGATAGNAMVIGPLTAGQCNAVLPELGKEHPGALGQMRILKCMDDSIGRINLSAYGCTVAEQSKVGHGVDATVAVYDCYHSAFAGFAPP